MHLFLIVLGKRSSISLTFLINLINLGHCPRPLYVHFFFLVLQTSSFTYSVLLQGPYMYEPTYNRGSFFSVVPEFTVSAFLLYDSQPDSITSDLKKSQGFYEKRGISTPILLVTTLFSTEDPCTHPDYVVHTRLTLNPVIRLRNRP